jgi:2-dehydro-3-deoxyphosphooctonate aldolase (KDO 8-P synthase)
MRWPSVVDVLQTPAFLVRQTDFMTAVARAGRPVNIKKGQFLAPWDMSTWSHKCRAAGNDQRLGVRARRRSATTRWSPTCAAWRSCGETGCPVVFDATHSVQQPGGQGAASGGQREMIPVLARAAVAAGVSGVFMEIHPDPASAWSDGPNQWPLDRAAALLRMLTEIDRVVKAQPWAESTL